MAYADHAADVSSMSSSEEDINILRINEQFSSEDDHDEDDGKDNEADSLIASIENKQNSD